MSRALVSKPSPQAAVRVFAPAKINWALTIRRKREDGYHDIDTVFQTVGVGDELICRPWPKTECKIECGVAGVPTGPENLIARAWQLLRHEYAGRIGGLHVQLEKRVPIGAGLGGGSSDAVAALFALNRIYDLRLRAERLEELAARLGSDCPFFVRGGTARGAGRGESLEPIANHLPPLWLVIVFPGFSSPTAQAYGGVMQKYWTGPENVDRATHAIEAGNAGVLQKSLTNVFSKVVFSYESRYKFVQETMKHCGLTAPLLSGSGSAMFSLCIDRRLAKAAARALLEYFPWVVAVPLRRSGVGFRFLA